MGSERQREANRRNGRNGGPKTEAGKQRSRVNSLKHGLTSETLVVLPDEHQHEYQAIVIGFRESFQPQDAAEDALVLRLAQAHWRSLRSRRVETGILNITAEAQRSLARKFVDDCPEQLNAHNAVAVGFMVNPAERWQMFLRYDTTISRDFFKTLDALTRLQRARRVVKPPSKLLTAGAGGAFVALDTLESSAGFSDSRTPVSDSGIRSVSQNSARHPERQPAAEPNDANKKNRVSQADRRAVTPNGHNLKGDMGLSGLETLPVV